MALTTLSGCELLKGYPNGGEVTETLEGASDPLKGFGIQDGMPMPPLRNPPTDPSVKVVNAFGQESQGALPGYPFKISLHFLSNQPFVVGGGIRLPNSDEVQWTFLEDVTGRLEGSIDFSFVLGKEACDGIPALCHEFDTEQFAVTRMPGGEFAVSEPVVVPIVLQCASCQSVSCINKLKEGTCRACGQPEECTQFWDLCFAPGQLKHDSDMGRFFELFMGTEGSLWSTAETCSQGKAICETGLRKGMSCDL